MILLQICQALSDAHHGDGHDDNDDRLACQIEKSLTMRAAAAEVCSGLLKSLTMQALC